VVDGAGRQVWTATEEDAGCWRRMPRQLCGDTRAALAIALRDPRGKVVMRLERELRMLGFACLPLACCLGEASVSSTIGLLGTIRRGWSLGGKQIRLKVVDAAGGLVEVEGPRLPCCSVTYILSEDGVKVGEIKKTLTGYGVSFPLNMDPKKKATVLGAIFMIDLMA